jgi:hypothetical protein
MVNVPNAADHIWNRAHSDQPGQRTGDQHLHAMAKPTPAAGPAKGGVTPTVAPPAVAAQPLLPRLLTEHRRAGPQQPLLGFQEFSLGLLRFIRLRRDGTEIRLQEDRPAAATSALADPNAAEPDN